MRKSIFLFFLFLSLSAIKINAQNLYSIHSDWGWKNLWWGDITGSPYIEFNYGLAEIKHDKLASKLAKTGLAEIKLGYQSIDSFYDDNIVQFDERYAFGSKLSTNLRSEKVLANELSAEMWRFGFGRRKGFGYEFNLFRILPYNQNAAIWSKLQMKDYPVSTLPSITVQNVSDDTEILKRYDGEFRFGTLSEGGIRIEIGSAVSFNAGYEAAVIFPRYLFWKHMGSLAIELAGQHAIDRFIDEVTDSSPAAGPIVSFVLKNGLSYAFYTFKKQKMNWPFNTETPLTYETLKLGVTFTF